MPLSWREFFVDKKKYIIIAEGWTKSECTALQAQLNKQTFTVVNKPVDIVEFENFGDEQYSED